MEADEQSAVRSCFERWQSYRQQGQLFSAKSDVALQLSQKRMLQVQHFTCVLCVGSQLQGNQRAKE